MSILLSVGSLSFTAASDAATDATSPAPGAVRRWDFDKSGDAEGWTATPHAGGLPRGGALWLTVQSPAPPNKVSVAAEEVYASPAPFELLSPMGLKIPASQVRKVRMRVQNLSPETDGYVFWRLATDPAGKFSGPVRYTMLPDEKNWQDVIAHIDRAWAGLPAGAVIDQLRLQPALMKTRGDIYIDWIAIENGPARPDPVRPDVKSTRVVPQIVLAAPVTQATFQQAFDVLDECLCVNTPAFGFKWPFMAPGGAYGENWWQLDGSLTLAGAKWVNPMFAENVIRGFIGVQSQNPDGRLNLWGAAPSRGHPGEISSLPRYFEVAFDVARRSHDRTFQNEILESMRAYLDWWFSPLKRDALTGLATGSFEETLAEPRPETQTTAPVDLNVTVAIGFHHAATLASALGRNKDAQACRDNFERLKEAINQYLWNEEKGFYFNYYVKEKRQGDRLIVSTFDPLRLNIAPPERVARLLKSLQDPQLFNWGGRPLTSISKTDPAYVEAVGPYDGTAWLGDIWTLRNELVIAGLRDVGRHDLAAELAWATTKMFNGKYAEYINPSTGSGEGVQRYGWSASQYAQIIIEDIFGVDYDRLAGRLRVFPCIPKELIGHPLQLEQLIIPGADGTRLAVSIHSLTNTTAIDVQITGPLPNGDLEVVIPALSSDNYSVTDDAGRRHRVEQQFEGLKNVLGVRMPMKKSVRLRFQSKTR